MNQEKQLILERFRFLMQNKSDKCQSVLITDELFEPDTFYRDLPPKLQKIVMEAEDRQIDKDFELINFAKELNYKKPKYTMEELVKIFPEIRDSISEILKERIECLEKDKDNKKIKRDVYRLDKLFNYIVGIPKNGDEIDEGDIETAKEKKISDICENLGFERFARFGENFKCCCPFHEDVDPSFTIYDKNNSFYCFGCNKGGDVIEFIMEYYGVNFIEAIKILI